MKKIKILKEIAPKIKILESKEESSKSLEESVETNQNNSNEATHSHAITLQQTETPQQINENVRIRQNEFAETRRTNQTETERIYGATSADPAQKRNYESVVLRQSPRRMEEVTRPISRQLDSPQINQLRNQNNNLNQNQSDDIDGRKYSLDEEEFRRKRRKTDEY